jgi:hypothetical protein
MDELNRVLSDNLALVVIVLGVGWLLLLVLLVVQWRRLHRATEAYRSLVGSGEVGSLGEVIEAQVGQVEDVSRRLGQIVTMSAALERRAMASIQHIGLVRFNPFEDTGSDQSFALALLDAERNGVVVSSLHGRANTRLFAKPVRAGASTHTLSDEEEQAIAIAVAGDGEGPRDG